MKKEIKEAKWGTQKKILKKNNNNQLGFIRGKTVQLGFKKLGCKKTPHS
jgi:hypothetical protein